MLLSSPACPSVRQLQSEMEEMNMLMKASRQQHAHRLLLVRRHTEDTRRWLSNVDDQADWVSRLLGRGSGDMFRAIAVRLCLLFSQMKPQTFV